MHVQGNRTEVGIGSSFGICHRHSESDGISKENHLQMHYRLRNAYVLSAGRMPYYLSTPLSHNKQRPKTTNVLLRRMCMCVGCVKHVFVCTRVLLQLTATLFKYIAYLAVNEPNWSTVLRRYNPLRGENNGINCADICAY